MKKHTAKLIEGNFSHEKAQKLLLELIHYKLNFHKLEKFTNEIRYGEDKEHSDKRIRELTKEKQELAAWLNALDKSYKINILCNIEVQIL